MIQDEECDMVVYDPGKLGDGIVFDNGNYKRMLRNGSIREVPSDGPQCGYAVLTKLMVIPVETLMQQQADVMHNNPKMSSIFANQRR